MSEPAKKTNGEVKTRKPRETKPMTFGKLLGSTIDQLDALDPHQRAKLLAAVGMHYNTTTREA